MEYYDPFFARMEHYSQSGVRITYRSMYGSIPGPPFDPPKQVDLTKFQIYNPQIITITKTLYNKDYDFSNCENIFTGKGLPCFEPGKKYMCLAKNDDNFLIFFIEVEDNYACKMITVYDNYAFNLYPTVGLLTKALCTIKNKEDYEQVFNIKFMGSSISQVDYAHCEI